MSSAAPPGRHHHTADRSRLAATAPAPRPPCSELVAFSCRTARAQTRKFVTDGIALGYRYEPSPICWPDGSPPPPDSVSEYHPTTRPGSRAPHAWLGENHSIIDMFGRGFTLLRFGDGAPDVQPIQQGFARSAIPLKVTPIVDPAIGQLYERRLVLVRPDGHVAWRSDDPPADPLALADRVRGANEAAFGTAAKAEASPIGS
jgi:hypothetical protein